MGPQDCDGNSGILTTVNTSCSFSADFAFPQIHRICTVDLSSHGNSDPRRLFVWSLIPSVQILLYTGPNSHRNWAKTNQNQPGSNHHSPFLRLTQCKCFLIEFPDVKYKLNTKKYQLQKERLQVTQSMRSSGLCSSLPHAAMLSWSHPNVHAVTLGVPRLIH